jgi:nitrous oxidase accessory protein
MRNTFTILFFLVSIFFSANIFASTIHIGNGKKFATVKQGLAIARDGDTLMVHAGEYYEQDIIINKKIYLKGIGKPVLDGDGKYEILTIHANDVVIEGFTLRRTGFSSLNELAGIKIYNCRNVTITHNILKEVYFGIYLQGAINCVIKDNDLNGNGGAETTSGDGIHCWKSDSLQIIHNSINNFRDGIYLEFVTASLIWRNTSEKNIRYGLHFMTAHNNAYITNIFRYNGAGVAVMYTHGVKMFNNYFENNSGDAAFGLLLKEITDSDISGNHFSNNTSGIFMEGGNRILVQRNLFKSNGWALKIEANCSDVAVSNNNYLANTFDISTNGSLVLNKFNNNYWDKYEGYDINKDNIGDVPYRPVSMYSMLVEQNPTLMMLYRSFITTLMDKTEKVLPSLIPEDLIDNSPLMKPLPL